MPLSENSTHLRRSHPAERQTPIGQAPALLRTGMHQRQGNRLWKPPGCASRHDHTANRKAPAGAFFWEYTILFLGIQRPQHLVSDIDAVVDIRCFLNNNIIFFLLGRLLDHPVGLLNEPLQALGLVCFGFQERLQLRDSGFTVRRVEGAELLELLAIYFEQDATHEVFDLVDGARWLTAETEEENADFES